MRPTCKLCGRSPVYKSRTLPDGSTKWSYRCINCKRKPWTRYKKEKCERCGFIPEHHTQLDVDHIDGDKNNNAPANFRTLCSNCHRLKTHLNQEYGKTVYK